MSKGDVALEGSRATLLAGNRSVRDLGDRLRKEEERPTDRDALVEWRTFNCHDFASLYQSIFNALEGLPFLLACRVKRLDSLVRKLRRQPNMTLERMDDLVGFRVLVSTLEAQNAATALLTAQLDPRREKNYVTEPQTTGYRAVHLIPRRELQLPNAAQPSQYSYEVQVRTYFQHLWSSTSESFGEQVKEGGGRPEIRDYLAVLSMQLRDLEESDPARAQATFVPPNGSLSYFAVQFDHSGEELIRFDNLGSEISPALAAFAYLERAGRTSTAREVAFLGGTDDGESLFRTHVRYFSPGGVPQLPEGVVARPGKTW